MTENERISGFGGLILGVVLLSIGWVIGEAMISDGVTWWLCVPFCVVLGWFCSSCAVDYARWRNRRVGR